MSLRFLEHHLPQHLLAPSLSHLHWKFFDQGLLPMVQKPLVPLSRWVFPHLPFSWSLGPQQYLQLEGVFHFVLQTRKLQYHREPNFWNLVMSWLWHRCIEPETVGPEITHHRSACSPRRDVHHAIQVTHAFLSQCNLFHSFGLISGFPDCNHKCSPYLII